METDKSLIEELEQFRAEKEKIRMLVGQIGGKGGEKIDKIINISFIIFIIVLFSFDILRHFMGINIPLPPIFSLEVGVLMVSIKIIWMIHRQTKVEHFQFWILNSIEFRLNSLSKQIKELNKKLEDK
ncbi:MAG: hypothetical protein ACTSXL_00970 [Alphaproteobacteria bacterium]